MSTNFSDNETSGPGAHPEAPALFELCLTEELDADWADDLELLGDERPAHIHSLTPLWGKLSSQQARDTAHQHNTRAAYRLLSTGRQRQGLRSLIKRHRRQLSRLLEHPDFITYTEAAYTGEPIWEELYHTLQHWLIARFCVSVCLFNAWTADSATQWRALLDRLLGGTAEPTLHPPPRRSRPAIQPRAPSAL